jgi:tetratricopeptide (TPR) repeat protein
LTLFDFALAEKAMAVADYGCMEISFETRTQKRVLLGASLIGAALICFVAARLWVADSRLHSNHLDRMERGAALVPGNGEAWDRVGHFRQWDLSEPDPAGAIADYERAVHDNPLSAHYWMDLASAREETGDISRAREAFERARAVYPMSAEVAWNYGNFLLRQEEYPEGFTRIQEAVRTDPSLLPLAISRTWRSNRDVNLLLDHVLPANVDAYFLALDFLASSHQTDAGLAVWQRLLTLGKTFPVSRSFPFLDELIVDNCAKEAHLVWLQALAAAGLPHEEPPHNSLIWNGDFARDFLNGGLDWRWGPRLGVAIDFDSAPPSYGTRSIRLDFGGGTNIILDQPSQFVAVEPSRTYHFHAYIRTEGISTESGVRFVITEPIGGGATSLVTENLTGSHPWTAVEGDIYTTPETHFLLVRLYRPPSRLFDNKLSGTAWVADVSLVSATAPTGQPAR